MPLDDRLRIAAVDLAVTGAPRALVEAVWLACGTLHRDAGRAARTRTRETKGKTARTMRTNGDFDAEYRALEARMRTLAEAEDEVFLPNLPPQGPVQHVLICMEPSLGRWARSANHAKAQVRGGFRNFVSSF